MAAVNGGLLQATYYGHAASTKDALILFEACLGGNLHHVQRRPHDRERASLIRPGSIFIYEENASGIKRWTDGVSWSPSRILGNFLVYRELDKPFPPGEKKRATKRNKRPSKPGEPYPRPGGENGGGNGSALISPTTPPTPGVGPDRIFDVKDVERALIGSLVDSYEFKTGGLIKKTMSVSVNGIQHHLVSYYTVKAVLEEGLPTPSADKHIMKIEPRFELMHRQNFRAPLEEVDDGTQDQMDGTYQNPYYDSNGYDQKEQALNNTDSHTHQATNGVLGYYGTPSAYSTASPLHNGALSYAPMTSSTGFYSQVQPAMQMNVVKQEDYGNYMKPQYSGRYDQPIPTTTDRSVSQMHQVQTYPYRHQSMSGISAHPEELTDSTHAGQESKPLDHNVWRGGVYAPTAASHMTSSHDLTPTYPTSQQWPVSTTNVPLGRRESMYYGDHQNYGVQALMPERHVAFQGQSHYP